ncbi:hypothetical protein GJ744_004379 [Endocarpon pusillum]|uniref:Uncharacterized protein n=1 Tax=Endocarpon pusillum TaxID=364733 RepID=A0A8H7AV16_9EURO|nr:hypothetical protein GJ744_004379 [Endocarpon pusillum]
MNRTIVQGTAVGQYIYPFNTLGSEGEGLMYQISDVLETPTSSMSIRRSKHRATIFEYPLKKEDFDREDVIYDIQRVTVDYQEFDLQPRGKDLLAGNIRCTENGRVVGKHITATKIKAHTSSELHQTGRGHGKMNVAG